VARHENQSCEPMGQDSLRCGADRARSYGGPGGNLWTDSPAQIKDQIWDTYHVGQGAHGAH